MSSSSTLRNSRIIIASLFLPHTVVLGPSDLSDEPETSPVDVCSPPEAEQGVSISVPEVVKRLEAATPQRLEPSTTPQPKSIVEDLKDRASRKPTPVTQTPSNENANPFSKLNTPKGSPPVKVPVQPSPAPPKPSLLSRPFSPPLPSSSALKRTLSRQRSRTLRTRASRSSSSRPGHVSSTSVASIASLASAASAVSVGSLDEEDEDEEFHIQSNQHCNGGLKNAIESVSSPPPAAKDPKFVPHHNRSNSKQLHGDGRLKEKFWVGTLGTKTDSWDRDLRGRVSAHLREKDGSQVVWVEDAVFEGCYDEFCHQVLWPALHYAVPDAPRTKLFYESASYSQYVAVNRAFAEKIAEVWKEGDIVWINDYHLMLLPHMLRSSGLIPSSAPIGFFLHVAFPSSEIFRCLSVRSHLLKGMLGADLVGFQTANYARHFRQTCTRVLGVEAVPRGVVVLDEEDEETVSGTPRCNSKERDSSSSSEDEHHTLHGFPHRKTATKRPKKLFATAGTLDSGGKGRFVDVGVFPMGIDVGQLVERKKEKEVGEWIEVLKARYKANGMKVIVGRDKLDEIQGVRQKIQAFEIFLEKNPSWVGKVVLIQLALPSPPPPSSASSHVVSATGEDTTDMASMILSTVAHVNSRFSTLTYQPVVFLPTQDVDFSQYLALLSVADAFLVTSLREGMALRTHEFVTCQLERGEKNNVQAGEERERKGVLILSEFTGSYSYSGFRSCIAINPWDARGTAAAINAALTMPHDEAHSRWEELHSHVITQTAQAFVAGFLTRCVRANGEHVSRHRNGDLARNDSLDGGVQELSVPKVVEKWKGKARRLVLVDWEGSLVGDYVPAAAAGAFATANAGADVTGNGVVERRRMKEEEFKDAVRVLKKLVEDDRNKVWLLSGLPIKGVLAKVAKEVGEKLGIVAENGCFIKSREPSESAGPDRWISMIGNRNMTWKTSCLEILNYFTERTPGSFVEEREASVVWRFWTGPTDDSSDRQWARRQAAEAQNHIYDSIGERYALRIIPGTNSFLVLPNNISRSTAVGAILHPDGPAQYPFGRAPWLIITEADAVPATVAEEWDCLFAVSGDEKLLRRLAELDNSETCSTSGKGTDAKWRVERDAVVPFLEELAAA